MLDVAGIIVACKNERLSRVIAMLFNRLSRAAGLLVFAFAVSLVSGPLAAAPLFWQEPNPAEKSSPKKKVKPEEKERVELLLKTKFDRTPNGILQAWSADKVKKKEKSEKAEKVNPPAAEITNAFKDFVFLKLEKANPEFKKDTVLSVFDDQDKPVGTIKLLTVEGTEISAKVQPKKTEPAAKVDSTAEGAASEAGKEEEGKKADEEKADEEKETAKPATPAPPQLDAKVGSTILLKKIDDKVIAKKQTERLQAEVAQFSKDVSLGNWDNVKKYFAEKFKDKKEAQKVYSYLLTELVVAMPQHAKNGAQKRRQAEGRGETPPKSVLSPFDVLALTEASPQQISIVKKKHRKKKKGEPEEKTDKASSPEANKVAVAVNKVSSPATVVVLSKGMPANANEVLAVAANANGKGVDKDKDVTSAAELSQIATLLRTTIDVGYDLKPLLKKFETGTTYFGGEDLDKRLTAADLLMRCKLYDEAERFIPKVDDSAFHDNIYSLRIWKQLADIRYDKKREMKWLKTVWTTNQNIFAAENAEQRDIDQALARLIGIAPLLDKSIGQKWLDESFTKKPERGVQILAALGSISAQNLSKANSVDGEERLKMLKLQNRAVEKLLEVSPDKAAQWGNTLSLLAQNWIQEAQISIDEAPNASTGMESDRYGNYYWNDYRSNAKNPIKIVEVLSLLPSDKWRQQISPLMLTDIKVKRAKLHLQSKEYAESFALMEDLAKQDSDLGHELAEEFLKVWTNINDPNSSRNRRNSYSYFYGYSEKAESIPLTRSKQDRSLAELSGWVDKIRELPIEPVEEQLLVNAFVSVHSSAEVYQMDRMESVFGDIKNLKPETIASLAQRMRQNLAGEWRSVKNQEENKTKRKAPEIIREVLRGYGVAHELTEQAIAASPTNWQLHLADASLVMDANEFQQSLQKSADYSVLRTASMSMFANAAEFYVDGAPELEKSELTTEVFDRWFYAALGAVDLSSLEARTLPMKKEFAKIKQAIESLPGDLADYHMGKFANNLFARMSPVKPELKYRYLKYGFEIAGDHPLAWEARELFQYYKDLVGEIKLDLQLDGNNRVGTDLFGVYVNIVHTQEIEREAGGFGKYATNQNQRRYSYNYGRPTEDYRDKFVDSVETALEDHFEIQSVTFMGEEAMESRPAIDRGWRVTPYAYIAMRAKGSEVDRVNPVALDMDFLDTSGFVVIPVESPELVVDCSADSSARPVSDLKLIQTLDERQINDGKLILEVSATGKGLIPDLDQLIDMDMADFEVASIADQGCLPTSFDMQSPQIQILSDRSWTVQYKAKDKTTQAAEFVFSDVKMDVAKNKLQRYEDADLVEADSVIRLEKDLSKPSYAWIWLAIPVLGLSVVGVAAFVMTRSAKPQAEREPFEVPEEINAFTVLSLLKDIKHHNGIDIKQKEELTGSINRVEKFYFGEDSEVEPADLKALATDWVQKVRQG
jgi:hypothetical protein